MKITSIFSNKHYEGSNLIEETVTIKLTNKEDNLQSKALYYLICVIDKMETNDYKDLDFSTKMQVDTRIDAAIEFLEQLKKSK
jgi:hypothetical protein